MNRFLLLGTALVAVVVAVFLLLRPAPKPVGNFDLNDLPRLGAETAPVTVVIVEDFKCPVCKWFEEQIAPELKTRYVDSGKVKVYSLIFPFLGKKFNLNPDDSVLAAQAARCVYQDSGNEAFQVFKTYLFRAQGEEAQIWATPARLTELAQNVEGLNQKRFQTCLTTNATLDKVNADIMQANKANVSGTPSVFVNGEAIEAPTLPELKDKLFKAIEAAQ